MGIDYEFLKTIKLKELNLFSTDSKSSFWNFCCKNGLVTVYDMLIFCRNNRTKDKINTTIITMHGIVALCLYKYFGKETKSLNKILNEFFINKTSIRTDSVLDECVRLCLLGLELSYAFAIYGFSISHSKYGPQNKKILYIKEFYEVRYDRLTDYEKNLFELIIKHYDEYENKEIKSQNLI